MMPEYTSIMKTIVLVINPFTPEVLKWTLPSLNLDIIVANRGYNRMANSVDPDKMASYKLSHLDQHYLQWCLYWSAGLKRLNILILKITLICEK